MVPNTVRLHAVVDEPDRTALLRTRRVPAKSSEAKGLVVDIPIPEFPTRMSSLDPAKKA